MPWIDRPRALAALAAAAPAAACLICQLLRDGAPLHRGRAASVLLPRYARAEGHLLVALHRHVTAFTDLDDLEWAEATALALRAARALEAELRPARCYVASLGTALPGLPMTSPHLHLHVLPVGDPDARPAQVLSWEGGVLALDDDEHAALLARLRPAWAAAGAG